jgi:hypothetical protein
VGVHSYVSPNVAWPSASFWLLLPCPIMSCRLGCIQGGSILAVFQWSTRENASFPFPAKTWCSLTPYINESCPNLTNYFLISVALNYDLTHVSNFRNEAQSGQKILIQEIHGFLTISQNHDCHPEWWPLLALHKSNWFYYNYEITHA